MDRKCDEKRARQHLPFFTGHQRFKRKRGRPKNSWLQLWKCCSLEVRICRTVSVWKCGRKCPALDPRMGRYHLREHLVLAISTHKAQFLTRLKQLISKRWRDPRDFNDSEHYNKRKRGFPRCKNL